MKFDENKYKYYTAGNKIIAVSTYAGKTVKGIAKCDPKDEFDLDGGKRLAAARCQRKVSAKRLKRAQKKQAEAYAAVEEAVKFYNQMVDYAADATSELCLADANLSEILQNL